jgi:2-hydroxychromene-2-carboxylate isomerase
MAALEFWFEFASTYSYLAVERIGSLAEATGVDVVWRPFLLGPIFAAQGWNDSPFNVYPVKGRYMWRDMERLCARYRLPLKHPSRFPRGGLLAARVVVGAGDAPWIPDFVRAVYRANFAEDREISEPSVMEAVLRQVGVDPAVALAQAATPATKEQLRASTEQAQRLGIFGAPSFVARGELFWGNDRLEDALAWASGAVTGSADPSPGSSGPHPR